MNLVEIYEGALPTEEIYKRWYNFGCKNNLGANCIFTGIVREENGFDGLSFDIYEPILQDWFNSWQEKALKNGVFLKMAHSQGNVLNHKSSYMSGVFSSQRKASLEIFDVFVEDFKHNAPIWKYDLQNNNRIYAKDRSHKLKNSGLLSNKG
ncbi:MULTISPECIES: molybdenum cofactor biosynthesis protein MoaE [Helicobacter]|uniref:Molybdopterin synthase catalytic subunit n=1 Tax=Helicobacter ibis TaxID=2962633 RepID=A0ABT4VD24_9HELI|nr:MULTISPECIES: molybdenum cofactor biosynthesis protein MoaE [Helicobacter]MDA3967330.1 molybdenum cofactor biosynthesis protein MoaE [Helicobacter sp. WB40]MDA3968601.1 molybdenum cofactor biosynthesis protein MoaE [Helicobacter ibis]